jgi:ribosomal protein S27AE
VNRRPTQAERELAERDQLEDGIDRDLERERPPFGPRHRHDLRARHAFQAGVIDSVNRAMGGLSGPPTSVDALEAHPHKTRIERHECPLCAGAVFAPGDSHLERIDCCSCGATLLTRRNIYGLCVVELDAGISAPNPLPAQTPVLVATVDRKAWTLAAVFSYVGAPGPERFDRRLGELAATGWRGDHASGERGWWWAVHRDGEVLSIGWSSGDARDRDIELGAALAARLCRPRAL